MYGTEQNEIWSENAKLHPLVHAKFSLDWCTGVGPTLMDCDN